MMRVGRIEPVEQALPYVGDVVAVGVFEVNQIRRAGDDDAAVPKLEASRVLHLGKRDHFIGNAVAVFVRQNDERVVGLLERLPLGISRPDSGPEAALRIDAHLHRVDHVVEHLFRGEDIGLHLRRELELGQGLLRLQVFN